MRPRKGRGVDAVSQPQRHLRRSVFIGRREPMTLQNGSGRDQPADRSRKTVSIEKRTQKKKQKEIKRPLTGVALVLQAALSAARRHALAAEAAALGAARARLAFGVPRTGAAAGRPRPQVHLGC